jgi:THO complex subunit 1
VQALIIMDFLISLSSQARERLTEALPANASVNKAVMYSDQVLSDEDVRLSGTAITAESASANHFSG